MKLRQRAATALALTYNAFAPFTADCSGGAPGAAGLGGAAGPGGGGGIGGAIGPPCIADSAGGAVAEPGGRTSASGGN